jgi:hypothetical protein
MSSTPHYDRKLTFNYSSDTDWLHLRYMYKNNYISDKDW